MALREPRMTVTSESLDVKAVAAAVAGARDGAIATFVGVVRDHNAGRHVLWLDYEAYAPLAVRTFEQIAAEAATRWPDARLAIHHRTGRVDVGEASVAIAAASPHRADAFAACRYAIERVKQVAPIWKHEHFEGGEVWIEGATADPADDQARTLAFARACT
jgi:molybdopterin synthase catalytic subunit